MGAELPVRIVADLSSFEKDLGKASRAQAQATAKAGALTKEISQGKEQMALLGAAAARIDPALGAVVNTASAGVGVLKGMASSLGAVTGIAAVAAGALLKASADLDAAESKHNDAAKAAIKAQLGIVDANRYVNEAIEKQEKISIETRKGYWRDWARSALDAFDAIAGIIPGVTTATNFYRKKLDELDATQAQNIKTLEAARDRNIELAEAQAKVTEARKRDKEAIKEQAAVLELVAQREADVAEYDDEQARKKSIDDENERVAAVRSEVRATAELAEAQGTIKDQMAHHAETAKAVGMAWLDTAGVVNDAVGGLFENSKAAALATAFVNIALGATKTIAELGATPFLAPALVAEGALGAAAIAKISQQSFTPKYHSGGVIPINAQPGEGILNRHGMRRLGPKGLDELNRGGSSGTGSVIQTTNVVGHVAMDTWAVKSLSRMSSPTRSAIQKIQTGVRPGRRDRTS
jgi:hypothetical protein